jgi:hypothetical protein
LFLVAIIYIQYIWLAFSSNLLLKFSFLATLWMLVCHLLNYSCSNLGFNMMLILKSLVLIVVPEIGNEMLLMTLSIVKFNHLFRYRIMHGYIRTLTCERLRVGSIWQTKELYWGQKLRNK